MREVSNSLNRGMNPMISPKTGAQSKDRITQESMDRNEIVTELLERERASAQVMRGSGIKGKLRKGKKLSPSEMEYLRAHDPQLYEQAKLIEEEREKLKNKLKSCQTKEEVRQACSAATMALTGGGKQQENGSVQTASSTMAMQVQNALKNTTDAFQADFSQMRSAAIQDELTSAQKKTLPEKAGDLEKGTDEQRKKRGFAGTA